MERIVELTKQILSKKGNIEQAKEELQQELEKELKPTGKLSRILELMDKNELNQENYEFMLRLISNDEELEKQINELKELKDLGQKSKDLEVIRDNFKTTRDELFRHIESLENTTAPKLNIPIIGAIQKRKKERENKTILKTKYELIIKIINDSRTKSENKNLKEKYTTTNDLKYTLDSIYKNCELGNVNKLKELGPVVNDKYNSLIDKVEKDISKISIEYKEKRRKLETYDKRLRDYTYQRRNNFVAYAIDKLSKRDFIQYNKETKEITINEPEEKHPYELMVFAIVALNILNPKKENEIRMNYVKKIDKQYKLDKNAKPEGTKIINNKGKSK